MKKITSLLVAMMFLFAGVNYAQTPAAVPAAKAKMTRTKTMVAHKSAAVKATAPAKVNAAGAHLTKSGAVDKRYKAAKTTTMTAKSAVHVKKNGTPDMRYKENKAAATK